MQRTSFPLVLLVLTLLTSGTSRAGTTATSATGPHGATEPGAEPTRTATTIGQEDRTAGTESHGAATPVIHHRLKVRIDPGENALVVEDTVTLPDSDTFLPGDRGHFVLHTGLTPSRRGEGARFRKARRGEIPPGFDEVLTPSGKAGDTPLTLYEYRLKTSTRTFTVTYQGTLAHPLVQAGETYARDFKETAGTITEDGVYLAGSSFWLPWFGEALVTFEMDVTLPSGWKSVSQGERTEELDEGEAARATWRCLHPQDQVYLVAGRWTEYVRDGARVTAMAFLREPDEGLANRYLDATERYIAMYDDLLGPYPYQKFALVENFWETGYGMPSFTLLGSRVIRLPFIITSSYPHEILHNWWGNGVYVDYSSGNWCEGLTAYLADHLLQEQRGRAREYRETTLQKYTDYAARGEDFPLTEFLERHSSTTEAVGYGKASMFFHMLRLELGDTLFIEGLRRFYEAHRFEEASWSDLEDAFEAVSGRSLQPLFQQWVERTGAPSLRLGEVQVEPSSGTENSYRLVIELEQIQPGPPYLLKVPVAVTLDGRKEAMVTTLDMTNARQTFEFEVPGRPLRVDVDPARDVFRTLDRDETPPALSGVFGAGEVTILVPSAAPETVRAGYEALAGAWREANPEHVRVVSDAATEEFPSTEGVWVLGWENRWVQHVLEGLHRYDVSVTPEATRIGHTEIPRKNHALVLAMRSPQAPDQVVALVAADLAEAMPGLARKLPHYHKYSYLGFEGDEPTNMAKGRWPVLDSPLTRLLPSQAQETGSTATAQVPRARLPERKPLVEPPPIFSVGRMMSTIRTLASEAFQGRAIGDPALDQAAAYIAKAFQEAGLQPGGDEPGSYYQAVPWPDQGIEGLDLEHATPMKNIIGIIPGRKAEWAGESVVVGAHYDHLGLGEIVGREQDRGQVHPGADDNASGVAVLLELARVLGQSLAPDRTVVFVAFTGEEEGLLGSRHYVHAAGTYPVDRCIAMINIDTVGRLEGRKLLVLGAGSAREWVHIFMGVGYTTGVQTDCVARDLGSSDQKSFLDAGVPAIQLFSGPHLDYHRPSDTPDKIDPTGLVQAATVVKEALEYLAGREGPLTSTLGTETNSDRTGGPKATRRVSLGTVPDFTYQETGVKLSGVVPGSPAQQAGLRAGDVIVRIDDKPIDDLRALSDLLKSLKPGDRITITVQRNGQEEVLEATVTAR